MAMEKKTVIGNWKMNPTSIGDAKEIFLAIKKKAHELKSIETVICPPFVYLNLLKKLYIEETVALGGQDVFVGDSGSFTGEISAPMLQSVGASFVIIGHSERRAMGEDNALVSKKVLSALKAGLNVILCVGEEERDHEGSFYGFLKDEILASLEGVQKKHLQSLLVAYEPVWAIGKKEKGAIDPALLREMNLFVRKTLMDQFKTREAATVPILYGGSVTPGNAEEIIRVGEVDGLLVGRESLDPKNFSEILSIVSRF